MSQTLASAISNYGKLAKQKLSNPSATGEPEDQLRAPFESLLAEMAELIGLPSGVLTAVGETHLREFQTRPDYSITLHSVLVGYVELKAPGKGADPRRYKGHDKQQWGKLQSLPNVLYSDGQQFSVWQNGELAGPIVSLIGTIEDSGAKLEAPPELIGLFERFLRWEPIPPRSASELAHVIARLCRFLREEVVEQMEAGSAALTGLAKDWRKLLFPEATNETFADGYAQAVTFGLLMARARNVQLSDGLDRAAKELGKTNSLIGAALKLLTDDALNEAALRVSLDTLVRVLDAVDWSAISKGEADAWLYFYEQFLGEYDNDLRKQTGSYYTPPEVVEVMVRLVDGVLRTKFERKLGFASADVKVVDPAVGTGTYVLGLLRKIASTIESEQGAGDVAGQLEKALERIIAFEMQLGPYAVAQLRIHAELLLLAGKLPKTALRLFVSDTLDNPYAESDDLGSAYLKIAEQRREANKAKKSEPIMVVIGNPPYKEKALGRGGWIESGSKQTNIVPLNAWIPPKEWGVGTHTKHLRNLYIYFWRWATWKVFDHHEDSKTGIVCFITVAGFLNGPGFQKMRDDLRRKADGIWVIDCSPDGHQPDVPTRIFQGVQQPVCIVLVYRTASSDLNTPAEVKFTALPTGKREDKFVALAQLALDGPEWVACPNGWRDPFLPASTGDWAKFPALDDLFAYNGSGVMPGRTWVISPDAESLPKRWQRLIKAKPEDKEALFHPHLRKDGPGDKHMNKKVAKPLNGQEVNGKTLSEEKGPCLIPTPYGFRSFDRQFIIPDSRLINQPNPEIWRVHSAKQFYLTAPHDRTPSNGPALSFTSLIPDLHHYHGRGGRVFPLVRDDHSTPNLPPKLLSALTKKYKFPVTADDFVAYLACVAAHPGYTARFQANLIQPGLRIPITAKAKLFSEALELGRCVIWLHTFGERLVDAKAGRPKSPPRLPKDRAPKIPKDGAIPDDPELMPDEIEYIESKKRLRIGTGFIDNVPPEVWNYEVSGKAVLKQWFSYRKKNRERPIIGDRRQPSKLGEIQPDHWLPEYTTELLNVIHILGLLVDLEPAQASLLKSICDGPKFGIEELTKMGALATPAEWRKNLRAESSLFADAETGD